MNTPAEKQLRLDECLTRLGRVLVAYSGGVDSAYLAWRAHEVLGADMLAMIADSPSLARHQLADATSFAEEHRIPLQVLQTAELDDPNYVKNDAQRCFHCKSELFTQMEAARESLGFRHLAYGMNLDDRGDFRPGQNAASRHGVLAPLVEAELTKQDIRTLAQAAGLRVWDKPASACLSSRIAYGQPVTRDVLMRVEEGENYLRQLGFVQFRVRDHAGIARIEIAEEEMPRLFWPPTLKAVSTALKALGFQYVTLDCEGYRSGSMNGMLPREALAHAPCLS